MSDLLIDGVPIPVEERSLENPSVPLWSPAAYNYLGAGRSSSGVVVDRITVLGSAAVFRAVSLISHKVARLPLNVYKRNAEGGRSIDREHPADWLLSRRPSTLYTPWAWKSTTQAHALLHGNAFSWIVRDDQARPIELVLLNPENMSVALNNGQVSYVYRVNQEYRRLLPENVFHIKGLSHDAIIGYPVVDLLRESFGLSLALQRHGSVFFRNAGVVGPTILKYPGKLDREQQKRLREEWDSLHVGLDNHHRMCIVQGGAEIQPYKLDNDSAQWLESREFEVSQVANIFNLPPHKLSAKVTTSYSSLESEERAFLSDCLDAWLCAWEDEAEAKLLKESQAVRDSHFVEFDRRSLEMADYRTRSETLVSELNNGLRTLDEARGLLNLPATGDGTGDRFRIPVNITFTDIVTEESDQPTSDIYPAEGGPPDEPEEPQEPPQTPPEDKPVVQEGQRLKKLLASVLRRFVRRLKRSPQGEHRSVLVETLAPVCERAEVVADELLAEWNSVLPEQRKAVKLDTEKWTEVILNGT